MSINTYKDGELKGELESQIELFEKRKSEYFVKEKENDDEESNYIINKNFIYEILNIHSNHDNEFENLKSSIKKDEIEKKKEIIYSISVLELVVNEIQQLIDEFHNNKEGYDDNTILEILNGYLEKEKECTDAIREKIIELDLINDSYKILSRF